MKEGFEGFCEMPGLQDESKISDDIVQKISNNEYEASVDSGMFTSHTRIAPHHGGCSN